MNTYFIGYDAREHEAAAVCAYSIRKQEKKRSKIYMLEHRTLRRLGLFYRDWTIEANGQLVDNIDGRPFSTEFSHSRFLAFKLAQWLPDCDAAMFVDCDWLFLDDPAKLLDAQRKSGFQISCMKRQQELTASVKMDGMKQEDYNRKLWSALFTFTPSNALGCTYRPDVINTIPGRDLHNFMGMANELIGDLDRNFHYIPSFDQKPDNPKGIHYSEWSPWINPEKEKEYPSEFKLWWEHRDEMLQNAANTGKFMLADDLEKDIIDLVVDA